MPYCMYLRKSRADLEAEARGEGETLSRHQQTLTLLAERLNIQVEPAAVYREIVSGDTIAARPVMQRLLKEVREEKWTGVLCTEIERLARGDTIDQGIVAQAFRLSRTRIITPAKTYDPGNEMDEEFFEFSLFMARREYKAIKRRMQAGRAASVREGHYVGGRRPFGYEVVRCPGARGYTLKQLPDEARIVRLVFDAYLYQGLGAAAIAKRLNAMGSTTSFGHPWNSGSIRHMLGQPVYAGFVQWRKRESRPGYDAGEIRVKRPLSDRPILAKGLHEGIVTPEEFEQAQNRAKVHPPVTSVKDKPIANPLAGLIRCGLCGYAITRRNNAHGVFLVCRNPVCSCSSARLDAVLAAVLDALDRFVPAWNSPAQRPVPVSADPAAEILAVQSALDSAERQLAATQDMLERGVYSPEDYRRRSALLKEKINAARQTLSRLSDIKQESPASEPISLPRIRRVLDAWPFAVSPAEQNALLRSVISRITFFKTAPLARNQPPGEALSLCLTLLPTPAGQQ